MAPLVPPWKFSQGLCPYSLPHCSLVASPDGHRVRTGHPVLSSVILRSVNTPGGVQLPETSCSWGTAGLRGSQAQMSWQRGLERSVGSRAQAVPHQDSPESQAPFLPRLQSVPKFLEEDRAAEPPRPQACSGFLEEPHKPWRWKRHRAEPGGGKT